MIGAIVLAAGQSRRMGTQKLLLPYGGQPVIAHIVDQLIKSRVDEIQVVVGGDGEQIAGALAGRLVSIIRNPDPENGGMLSSVRCGLKALPPECEAILVALGDQPAITAGMVDQIIHEYRRCGLGIVVPCFGGKRGHPMLCTAHFRDDIMTKYDEVGLRGLLQTHPNAVFELEAGNAAVLSDMDTPEDYQRELARLEEDNDTK